MTYLVSPARERALTLNETETVASVLQNVAVILGTPKGSVPMYRNFGISTRAVDRTVPVAKTLLVSDVKEAVELYEPRAKVVSVTFEEDAAEPGRLIPTVEVEIVA